MQDCPLYEWVMDLIRLEMKKPRSVIDHISFSDFNAPITIEYLGRMFALRVDEITPQPALKPGVLTFEQFVASRQEIDSSDEDFATVYGDDARGYSYASGGAFIQDSGDGYHITIENYSAIHTNLSDTERVLYNNFYLPNNNN